LSSCHDEKQKFDQRQFVEHQGFAVRGRDSLRRILEVGIRRIGLPETTLQVKGSEQADNLSRLVTAPDHTAAACRARRTVLKRKLPPKAGPANEGATA
jgi:DNA-binding helix-hairpin-helix protein with protein kinase domain